MTSSLVNFWERIAASRSYSSQGAADRARLALRAAREIADRDSSSGAERRKALIQQLYEAYGLEQELNAGPEIASGAAQGISTSVSLVTACRNRNENLKRALPSWIACPQITEIVIVDWTSEIPVAEDLAGSGISDHRIRVVRVDDEPRWILSYAFNLGFQSAKCARILKADADIVIEPDFFNRNLLRPKAFIAGNWRTAARHQAFVNGFFYVKRAPLIELGGFNEYITTYGWDDEELYARLIEHGLVREDVAGGSIHHLPHNDAERTERASNRTGAAAAETLPGQTSYLIRRNRQIANMMPTWSGTRPRVGYEPLPSHRDSSRLRRIARSGGKVPNAISHEADLAAARELMSWRLGDECYALELVQVEHLIQTHSWEALKLTHVREVLGDSPATGVLGLRADRQRLFVDAQHGLGNRLRAIGSAAAAAAAEDRDLVIIWRPDHHCDCRFDDLFDYDGEVRDDLDPESAARDGAVVFNYMEIEPGAEKNAPVWFEPDRDVYFRSAFVINHKASHWDAENRFLKSLVPTEAVEDLVGSVRSPNDVAAHVRMAGGPQFEHLAWENKSNWTDEAHSAVSHWRRESHYERFLTRLSELFETGAAETVFVAADLPETYEMFTARFGSRAAHLSRQVNDRSREQLQYALADAILLSRAPRLLGSSWSSFSELAMRLAGSGLKVEMTGKDF
ncbi:galactosyltransferase-related protein [Maricaulaceae bacterium EIL42A08]|nr:galactosyltransferase-related protein [Maricaulaceae bacterium EIL42A08]